jgi:flagellar hook assembly protein FlgD
MTPHMQRLGQILSKGFAGTAFLAALWSDATMAASTRASSSVSSEVVATVIGSNTLRLEYRPSSLRLDTVVIGNIAYTRVSFSEALRRSPITDSGYPDIPYRQIPVAFPTRSQAEVRIVAADYQDLPGVTVLPIPRLRNRDGFLEPAEYPQLAQGLTGKAPETIVELVAPTQVRSALIGGVRVWPVQYDPSAHSLRTYSRIVVEITFGEGPTVSVRASDAALLGDVVANSSMMKGWQVSDAALRKAAATSSVLASGDWYRISVSEEGIYRIDAAYFAAAGISASSLDPRTIKIYNNSGKEVEEDITASRTVDLAENAIYVSGESDGTFDSGDYILFYGRGTRGMSFNVPSNSLRHYINHYGDVNYYWLTFGGVKGKRMATQTSLTVTPTSVVEQFRDGIFSEDEKVNLVSSGKDWLGQAITGPSGSFTYVNSLPGLVTDGTMTYRYSLAAHDESLPYFTVKDNGVVLGTYYPGTSSDYVYATGGVWQSTGSSTLTNATSQLTFTFNSSSSASEAWIDYYEILFPRMLWAVNDYLRFRSVLAYGVTEYRLQQFTTAPMIFNVTDYANVQLIGGVSGSYIFRDSTRTNGVNEYCAAGSKAWKTPSAIQKISNQNLHGYATGADFVIITSSEFRSAADRLKTFRASAAGGGLSTIVVDVNEIYNEFGGGIPDITAIRDYLYFAYTNWTLPPTYVLFLGGASYDYKGILGSKSSFVPTWQSPESRHEVNSYATDDFFVAFSPGSNMLPYIATGRIACRTPAEANTVVDKLIRYEDESVTDSWKTRVLFVGDDAWTSDGGEIGDGPQHSVDAETLSGSEYTPDEFEKKKIYIAEYPTVYTAAGRRKPGAAQDIIDNINQGVLMLNFSGHGNPKVWAHESIFDVNTSIPPLVNSNRLAVLFLATCNFSQFDDPKSYTGSILLMNKSDGGAAAVISASRKVYATGNAALNKGTYRQLFTRDAYGRLDVRRPATALFLYKASGHNDENDRKFFFMGDPTMHLAYPRGYASIDSINGEKVDSVGGAPRTSPIVVKALAHVTVAGTVRNSSNLPDTSFRGTLSLRVNDVSKTRTIVDFYPGYNWAYLSSGGTIYKGENSVLNGKFHASFIVPKDISYADTTGTGRVTAYLTRSGGDAAGFTGEIRISGADSSAAADAQGPTVRIALGNRTFKPGDVVNEHPTLLVDMHDTSGINTSTSGIGHRVEAWLNNSTQSIDLTDHYTSTLDDFRSGTVQMDLGDLPAGRNTIRVRAWDSYNNSTTAETYFEVASSSSLSISDVFNYPNPFAGETMFTFRHNQIGALNVDVKIYTVAGRLIQTLHAISSGELMVSIPWDGRDRDGDKVANGVYLYKVVVRTIDGVYGSEALGKLAVAR